MAHLANHRGLEMPRLDAADAAFLMRKWIIHELGRWVKKDAFLPLSKPIEQRDFK
jgi:hypothetical protein